MAPAPFLALALLLAQPAAADGPIGTAPQSEADTAKELEQAVRNPAPAPQAAPAAKPGRMGTALPVHAANERLPKLNKAAAEKEPVPPGAPSDDYGLVAWCYGALQGHMALFEKVRPDLDSLPDPDPRVTAAADAEMMQAGREYLTLYTRALRAAEKGQPSVVTVPAADSMKIGRSIWDKAEVADPKTRMWSWAMWTLPGKCEYAAERLYEKSMLAGAKAGINMRTAPVPKVKMD